MKRVLLLIVLLIAMSSCVNIDEAVELDTNFVGHEELGEDTGTDTETDVDLETAGD